MSKLPETTKLITELNKGWLTIWFNAPENKNALSQTLTSEFEAVLDAIRDDRSVRGVTLRGKNGVFCSGGDLKGFFAGQSGDDPHTAFKTLNRKGGTLFDKVMTLPQVVIAYVEGAAIAGGLGLMCCADIIIVRDNAKFALTETRIGIVPAQIAPIVVARAGLPKARQIMLTGAQFLGKDTPDYNLSDFVVEDETTFKTLEERFKSDVLKCAPGAIGVTKDILMQTPHMSREAQLDFAAEKFADCITSDEGREGIASFVGKRKPKWAETNNV